MMMPKKVKYRKQQRGRMTGKAWRGSSIAFGEFGLKAMECGWITDRQIEAARIAMTRSIKRGGKVWIRLFPDKPITKKPAETRMGKGKGAPEQWVAVIRPGKILFEMEGVDRAIAAAAMRLAAHKLPMRTKFVARGARRSNDMKVAKSTRSRRPNCSSQLTRNGRAVVPAAVPDVHGADGRAEEGARDAQGARADLHHPARARARRERRSKMAEAQAAKASRTRRSAKWSRPRCRRPSWSK